jgi:uncharacterized membrane protein
VSNLTTILVLSAGAVGSVTVNHQAETLQETSSLACAV